MIAQHAEPLHILDFDIENRPLSYWYDGQCTAEVTAVAWSWVGDEDVYYNHLEHEPESLVWMLSNFREAYDEADIVTGHYIRKHDLPILNGAMVEAGLGPLAPKLTCDTRLDLVRLGAMPATQEHLASMLKIHDDKYHMTQAKWREANRLTPAGIAETITRVTDDVIQHKALRAALLAAGMLRPPRRWYP